MEVGADQNFHTSCTPVLRNLHGQLLQCTWLSRQHPLYIHSFTLLPANVQASSILLQCCCLLEKSFHSPAPATRLSSWSPASEHSSSHLLDSWGALWWQALPLTLPTDSGDLSPSRLRWPCPQNFCTTRSPFHIIPGFTHRGQGSLFFGIRGETYCLNTHFLKQIS